MHEDTLFSFLMIIQVCTSISDLIQPEGQKHIIPHYKLQQSINLHKIPPEKTSAALFIKGILAQSIWRIFYTLPDLLIFPLSAFFSLHWKSREWKSWSPGDVGYGHTHDRSGPTYRAAQHTDSHTHISDTAREGAGSVKAMF